MNFWEYVSDMSFVLVALIGSIIAIFYAYMRRTRTKANKH